MKFRNYWRSFFLFYICISSCKSDFLEVVDMSALTRQGYVRDLNSMNEFLNGTYGLFSQYFMNGIGDAYPEIISDNLKPLSFPPQNLLPHYSWSQSKGEQATMNENSRSLNMNGSWKGAYFIIRTCNFIIEDVEKYRLENPSIADNIKGQAYALRALLYFKLVNVFAQTYDFSPDGKHPGVPYITTSDITKHYTRQTVAEDYDNMISDLKNAINLLPEGLSVDVRHINNYAARCLLARIYMFKGEFDQVKGLTEQLCKEVPLLTISRGYPDGLCYHKPLPETEVLFQATPSDVYFSKFLGVFFRGSDLCYVATNDIAQRLRTDSNDVRSKWITYSGNLWNVTKFPVGIVGASSNPAADYYHPVLRSSEAYLMAAEACAMLGEENGARKYLNAIRTRANPMAPLLTIGGTELIDAIREERRKELCFEGLRMYDIQRWHQPVIRQDALDVSLAKLSYPDEKAISPIPMQDVNLEKLPQNIGY